MSKRIVLIGATGAGKSTLANILAGKGPNDDLFPAGHAMKSMTHVTTVKKVKWRGEEDSFDLDIVDTPGLDDTRGPKKDGENMAAMTKELKKLGHVNLFLIVINGANARLDRTMKELLRIFRDMFGDQFLDNTLFEVTNWRFDRSSMMIRKSQNGKTTDTWEADLNMNLKEMMLNPSKPIPAVFIDSWYFPEDEDQEKEFEMNLGRLRTHLELASDFSCDHIKEAKRDEEKAKERAKELVREREEALQAKKEAEARAKKAEEDKKRAEAAREKERQEEEKRRAQEKQKLEETKAQMAGLNHVKEVERAVGALDYSVKFQLTIENNTKYNLEAAKFDCDGGYVSPGPKSVKPKCSGSMGGHKTGGCATGAEGAVAWRIGTTGKMVVVMYSLPYSFDWHSNWCGVGIFDDKNISGFFDLMYNRTETSFKRKDFYNNLNAVSYSCGNFRVTAKMGWEHKTHIKVTLQ